jgi:hypothetical protein
MVLMLMMIKLTHTDDGDGDGHGDELSHGDGDTVDLHPQSAPHSFLLPPPPSHTQSAHTHTECTA